MDRNRACILTISICTVVALRKESVDRNTNFHPAGLFDLPSLSARRAWIEIPVVPAELTTLVNVALRKESVDRNAPALFPAANTYGRSPQGERG